MARMSRHEIKAHYCFGTFLTYPPSLTGAQPPFPRSRLWWVLWSQHRQREMAQEQQQGPENALKVLFKYTNRIIIITIPSKTFQMGTLQRARARKEANRQTACTPQTPPPPHNSLGRGPQTSTQSFGRGGKQVITPTTSIANPGRWVAHQTLSLAEILICTNN